MATGITKTEFMTTIGLEVARTVSNRMVPSHPGLVTRDLFSPRGQFDCPIESVHTGYLHVSHLGQCKRVPIPG